MHAALLFLLLGARAAHAEDQLPPRVDATDLALLQESELAELAPLTADVERRRAAVGAAALGVRDAEARREETRVALEAATADRRLLRAQLRVDERVIAAREAAAALARARLSVAEGALELARLEQLRGHHQVDNYVHGDFLHRLELARWSEGQAALEVQAVLDRTERARIRLARIRER